MLRYPLAAVRRLLSAAGPFRRFDGVDDTLELLRRVDEAVAAESVVNFRPIHQHL